MGNTKVVNNLNEIVKTPSVSAHLKPPKPVVADTGATTHCFEATGLRQQYIHTNVAVTDVKATTSGIQVVLPNSDIMQATHTGQLDIPGITKEARTTHIFANLASGSLLSIGQLCDAGCTATFTDEKLYIYKDGKIILQGERSSDTNKLWTLNQKSPSSATPCHSLNAAIDTPTIAERIKFFHASLWSPVLSTLSKALDAGFLTTFPEFTSKQLRKHPPHSEATVKGHMHAQRSNIRSTAPKIKVEKANNAFATPTTHSTLPHVIEDEPDEVSPPVTDKVQLPQALPKSMTDLPLSTNDDDFIDTEKRLKIVYPACIDVTGQIYTDQTGQFLVPSISGNKYLFILYDYDSNLIHAEPMTSRTQHQILAAYKKSMAMLKSRGFTPQLQRLDNEASKLLRDHMTSEGVDFQLTPAGLHRRNAAERAIQTFVNHFIAGLCSTDPNFPLNQWDKLLPHALLSLNLLRASRVNPKLSSYAQIHGAFDYNRTPLAPPGIRVLAHVRTEDRKSWTPHAEAGYYVGPAMDHYRCHRIWFPDSQSERIAQTTKWFPAYDIKMPIASREALILAAARELSAALSKPTPDELVPALETITRQNLKKLSELFSATTVNPPAPEPPQHPTALPRVTEVPTSLPRVTPTTELPRVPPLEPSASPTYTSRLSEMAANTKKKRKASSQASAKLRKAATQASTLASAKLRKAATQLRRSSREKSSNRNNDFQYSKKKINSLLEHVHNAQGPPKITGSTTKINALLHHLNAVQCPITGKQQEYKELISEGKDKENWINGSSKEFARLAQGRKQNDTPGTDTLFFKPPNSIPAGRKATYCRFVTAYRPQKEDPYRVRLTVGGNLIEYPGITYTPVADLNTAKVLFNSVVSTAMAKFLCIDIKNFYLNTEMERFEYMWIPIKLIPADIIEHYNLNKLVHNGNVLTEVRKGMYGLPQAGRLAYDKLTKHLATYGYTATATTPGLFTHATNSAQFTLVVDDFGVKYTNIEDAKHLIACINELYSTTIDWEGKVYCGLHLEWDYVKRTVTLSMPEYIKEALIRFGHIFPKRPQHSPHPFTPPQYGAKQQMTDEPGNWVKLTDKQRKHIEAIVGVFLYYGRALDNTMLPGVGAIATAKTTASHENLQHRIKHFMDYAATHPDAKIRFVGTDMHLWIHTDASYLNEPKARSRGGGHFFFSDKPTLPITPDQQAPTPNAPVLVNSKVLDAVMSSAQESETGMGFVNAKDAIPLKNAAIELGHLQGPTPLQFDNKVAVGIMTDTVKQKRSKAMDMRFYWLRDRAKQGQFHIHWKSGSKNLADLPTKHHPAKHHIKMRPQYVLNYAATLRSKANLIARVC